MFRLRLALVLVVVLTVAENLVPAISLLVRLFSSPSAGSPSGNAVALAGFLIVALTAPQTILAVGAVVGLFGMQRWGRWLAVGAMILSIATFLPGTGIQISSPHFVSGLWALAAFFVMSFLRGLLWAAIVVMIFRPPLAQMFRQVEEGRSAVVDGVEQDLTAPEAHRDPGGSDRAVLLLRLALILVVVLTVALSQKAVAIALLLASQGTLPLASFGAAKQSALVIVVLASFLAHAPHIASASAAMVGLYRMWSWGRWMAVAAAALAIATAVPATMRLVSVPYDLGHFVWGVAAFELMSIVTALLWAAILVMIFRPPLAQMFNNQTSR